MALELPARTAASNARACKAYLSRKRLAVSEHSTAEGPFVESSSKASRSWPTSRVCNPSFSSAGSEAARARQRLRSTQVPAISSSSSSAAKSQRCRADPRASASLAARAARTSCKPACHLPCRARALTNRAAISTSKACRSAALRLMLLRTARTVLRYWAPCAIFKAFSRCCGFLALTDSSTGPHQVRTKFAALEALSIRHDLKILPWLVTGRLFSGEQAPPPARSPRALCRLREAPPGALPTRSCCGDQDKSALAE
mmetsp:Transcript_21606/g.74183  ORF Transcript_21606/g.74183 Transcript_21606/m.74183 type:complete len:257 (-) Transcript_21606:127-897(-)